MTTQCLLDEHCGNNYFCMFKANGNECMSCWKCCLFPESYGKCPNSCNCNIGAYCDIHHICGQGLECNYEGKCEKPFMSNVSQKILLFRELLNLHENKSISTYSGELNECVDDEVTKPGCPCNKTESASSLLCPAGYVCTQPDKQFNELDAIIFPKLNKLGNICKKCNIGEYCPPGIKYSEDLLCPSGSYCPNASIRLKCDPGYFCRKGTVSPQTCDMSSLLMSAVYIKKDDDKVVDRLIKQGDILNGNYCPIDSTTPLNDCTAGYYCPNASVKIPCPKGSYCKIQSTYPIRCPPLSKCPMLTVYPQFPGIVLLFELILILIITISSLYRYFLSSKQKKKLSKANISDVIIRVSDEPWSKNYKREMFYVPQTQRPNIAHMVLFQCSKYIRKLKFVHVKNMSVKSVITNSLWLWKNDIQFNPGNVNAIIGPSGCGKTTLLDVFRVRIPSNTIVTGTIHLQTKDNDEVQIDLSELHSNKLKYEIAKLQSLCGFVPQDDIIHPDLTVRENFLFSARIKSPNILKFEQNKLVDAVITSLELETLANNIVGNVEKRGISGGQRKRVNIGTEIVGLPSILLMDEPTSGLDSTMTYKFLQLCKVLANQGITIVCVVHQPRYSCFMLFDNIIFLTKYGTAFYGTPVMAITYIHHGLKEKIDLNENPADFIVDIISSKQEYLVNTWKSSGELWTFEYLKMHPYHDIAMKMTIQPNIEMLQYLESIIDLICSKNDDNYLINTNECQSIFRFIGIDISINDIDDFISYCNNKYKRSFKELAKKDLLMIFQYITESTYLEGKYENIIDRLALVTVLPKQISESQTTYNIMSTINAFKFGKKLIEKTNISKHKVDALVIHDDIILASLNVKALNYISLLERESTVQVTSITGIYAALRLWTQIPIICHRKLISLWRSPWQIQMIIPTTAAIIIGLIQTGGWNIKTFPNNIVLANACLGVLSSATHVRTYSLDKTIIQRETDGPMNIISYFISYCIIDILWILVMPLLFGIPYYYLTYPLASFTKFYTVWCFICWWCSGMAYMISAFPLGIQWINLIAVFISVIFGAFLHGMNPSIASSRNGINMIMLTLSYNRWGMEILTLEELSKYTNTNHNIVWLIMSKIGLCGENQNEFSTISIAKILQKFRTFQNTQLTKSCYHYIQYAYIALFLSGLAFRIIAFIIFWINNNIILQQMFTVTFLYIQTKIKKYRCLGF